MKKITAILFALLLSLCCVLPALGSDAAPADAPFAYVTDEAGLLTPEELADLNARAAALSSKYRFTVAILTVADRGNQYMTDFADDYYDYTVKPYGAGGEDGVLLVVDMSDRYMYISTSGYGIVAFTDYGIEIAEDKIAVSLGLENYANAFSIFLEETESYFQQAQAGTPFDIPDEPLRMGPVVIVCFFISLIIALIVTGSMKSQLQSVTRQTGASQYTREGSMQLQESRDSFLYRNVARSARVTTSSGSSSRGGHGGSTTHVSHSGSTHGGGGRHF